MKKMTSQPKRRKVVMWIIISVVAIVLSFLAIQAIRCSIAIRDAKTRLETYNAKTVTLSYGDMTYVDEGEGDTVLCAHGIFGGYDQAFDSCREQVATNRVIAPSRFGYLGSDVLGGGTPKEQADAYVELLDKLGIDKVYILGTSAGGTAAIRFALDYPERTLGLILYSSAHPLLTKPSDYTKRQGPPSFLINDYAMFLISPLFEPIMGMEPSTIYSMLPIGDRKAGVEIDATITNPDMARNFDDYPIESLKVPTLILQAEDDKLVNYTDVEKVVGRFPDCTFVHFKSGGHLMVGHDDEIMNALNDFKSSSS